MREELEILQRRNNQRDGELSWENKACMTDIICYLRQKHVEEYKIEDIRQDITDMLLEAQDRGDSAGEVLGEDYRGFCDEILESLGERKEETETKRKFCIFTAWLPWLGFFISGFAAFLEWKLETPWNLDSWLGTMWYLIFYLAFAGFIWIFTRKMLPVSLTWFFKGKRILVPVVTVGFFLIMQMLFYLNGV